MLILYGSQTGTTEEVAEALACSASERGIDLRWLPMDEYDVRLRPIQSHFADAAPSNRL